MAGERVAEIVNQYFVMLIHICFKCYYTGIINTDFGFW